MSKKFTTKAQRTQRKIVGEKPLPNALTMQRLPLSIASDAHKCCLTNQLIRHEAVVERGLGGEVSCCGGIIWTSA
jgi:hypothetical protein